MAGSDDFRAALIAGDVRLLRRMWASWFPGMPQPPNAEQAEIVMHLARTSAETVPLKHRAWSHRWLLERDLPSRLPDNLKPSAERLYPAVVTAVGVSVNMRSPWLRPAADEIRSAVNYAIEDAYADGRTDPVFVTQRMNEAKVKTMQALFGR